MAIIKNYRLRLDAGNITPLIIHVNQYDKNEIWNFTLIDYQGNKYITTEAAIVGKKPDGCLIVNNCTVSEGIVSVEVTEQMTAAAGKAVFELLIDGQVHGTANFIVMIERSPKDGAIESESDLSLFQRAIDATSTPAIIAGVQAWMDDNLTPTTPVVDSSLSISGAAADAKAVGDELSELKSEISSKVGLTNDQKYALKDIVEHIGIWTDGNAQTYIDNFMSAFFPSVNLSSISAVYEQSGDVYATTPLDDLKTDLVVTAHYSDGTNETVTSYLLSGVLAEGTSTITVTYGGKTTTFTVIVTRSASHDLPSGFQEVTYIASGTGNLGFTLGSFRLPSAFSLEAKTQLDGWNTNATYGNVAAVFEAGSSRYGYELAYKKDGSTIVSFLGAQSVVTPSDIDAEIIFGTVCDGTNEQAYMVVNGERVYGSSAAVSRTYTNNYFGVFYGGVSVLNQFVGKLFYLKVSDSSDNTLLELIPCYRKSNSAIGLYDTVSNTFFTNDNDTYTKGADVV